MNDVTITIDVQIAEGDEIAAQAAIAETLDELIGEALAGGAFNFAGDVEILGYQVIADE